MMKNSGRAFLLLSIFIIFMPFVRADLNPSIVSQVCHGVVNIKTHTLFSAYSLVGDIYGSGFIVDKEQGLIVTAKHVIKEGSVSTYEVTFQDGHSLEAKCLYMDPWQDFAVLKVDPEKIGPLALALTLKPRGAAERLPVFIVGNNEGQGFSIQTGEISSLYMSAGPIPCQSFRISLNAQGGASGSPICNAQGEIIGLLHSGAGSTFAFALPIEFVADALSALQQGKRPPRQGAGVLLFYRPFEKIAKATKLSEAVVKEYGKKYPAAFYHVLSVDSVLEDSPAKGKILPRDILLKIEGQDIGPDFYQFDKIMNQCKKGEVRLTVLREGKTLDILVKLYDLHQNQIQHLVLFGGALFYQADEHERIVTGVKKGDILVKNFLPGRSFDYDVFPPPISFTYNNDPIPAPNYRLERLSSQPIKTLDHLIKMIPLLMKAEDFTIQYANTIPFLWWGYIMASKAPTASVVTFNTLDGPPQIFHFNAHTLSWETEVIPLPSDGALLND